MNRKTRLSNTMRIDNSINKFYLPAFFILLFIGLHIRVYAGIPVKDSIAMQNWVDKTLSSFSVREKVAQLIMPMIYPTSEEQKLKIYEYDIQENQWGGILYQKSMLREQKSMNDRLQKVAKVPMLISLDGEWGLYMRLKDAPRFPRNMGLGYSKNIRLIYEYGQEVARECKLMGIHINFAPVLDVNNNPKNPVIGTRSFGDDPETVATCAIAYARGLEDGGVLSVGKHFPGHGNTDQDSHKTLPSITSSFSELERVELLPFRRYIDAGMEGIMVAHLKVPALDPDGTPTSLSKKVTTELLREKMNFRGLIVSDALAMAGAQYKGKYTTAVMAFLAGNDILLAPASPKQTLNELLAAYEEGIITEQQIDERCRRILMYKYKLIVEPGDLSAQASEVKAEVNNEDAQIIRKELWNNSIYIEKEHPQIKEKVNNNGYKRMALVTAGATPACLYAGILKKELPLDVFGLPAGKEGLAKLFNKLKKYDLILVGAFTSNATINGAIGRISALKPTILTLFTNPYALNKMGQTRTRAQMIIHAFESCEEAQRAAADMLLGNIDSNKEIVEKKKTLPVTAGFNLINPAKLSKLDEIALEGIDEGAFPGCQILVMKDNKIIYDKCFGTLTGKKDSPAVNEETYYDLASLTKACVTTPAIMQLVAARKIALNAGVSTYLPQFKNTPLANVTVKQLLLHEAGLIPTINFYTDLIDPESYTEPLISNRHTVGRVKIGKNAWGNPNFKFKQKFVSESKNGKYPETLALGIYLNRSFKDSMMNRIAETNMYRKGKYKYSDIGFILLQQIIEKVSGQSLDAYAEKKIFAPIEAKLFFRPLEHKTTVIKNIAPTQVDLFLRKQEICGTVDDETAACFGGVSGSAGLYGNTHELAKLMMLFANKGTWNKKEIIDSKTFNRFITETGYQGIRNLGFDKPRLRTASSAAESASRSTFGHTGFTGTCFWIDPQYNLVFIFLSNRTYPSRLNTKLMTMNIRPRLHQAVYDSMVP